MIAIGETFEPRNRLAGSVPDHAPGGPPSSLARLTTNPVRPSPGLLLAEVVANVATAVAQLARRGKLDRAFPSPLVCYAVKQVRSGRLVGGRLNVRDGARQGPAGSQRHSDPAEAP